MLTMHAMPTLSLSRNIVLFGSAAAAFVAGVYVIWGPNQKKRTKRKGTMTTLDSVYRLENHSSGSVQTLSSIRSSQTLVCIVNK